MAYDFGTNTLGIKNPFKPEGVAKTISGLIICGLGVVCLLGISDELKVDIIKAWVNAILGFVLLTWGCRRSGAGLFQLFRYYVGRSVPTSLSYNNNISERANADLEKSDTFYTSELLESMLMGRKNSTFVEPLGWTARLIHSLLPKLIFMPYAIRNYVQELAGLVIATVVALLVFGIAYFVSNSGLAGNAGSLITPILSVMLLLYMVMYLIGSAASLRSIKNRDLHCKNPSSFAKLIAIAIIVPILLGYSYTKIDGHTKANLQILLDYVFLFSAWFNLALLFSLLSGVIAASWVMIRERFKLTNPETTVSEFRENMQESIHPKEIFINIENIVLANRRFKEIPNRVYQDYTPNLQQSQDKGSFEGKLLIETQPDVKEIEYSVAFKTFRMIATIISQILVVAAAVLLFYWVKSTYDIYVFVYDQLIHSSSISTSISPDVLKQLGLLVSQCLTLFFSWQTVSAVRLIFERGTFLFWSEMQFSSLLLWMKTEGTYTESKISTGMAIYDSTRSENVVVRSSITPWIMSARIVTSIFAVSGAQNLELPRLILQMSKNEEELQSIVNEIKTFLRGREAIASITNAKDLNNAEMIYRVNEASRTDFQKVGDINHKKQLEEQAWARRQQDQIVAQQS